MPLQTSKAVDRHSRLKLALVPVLLCVLAAVLYDPQLPPPAGGAEGASPGTRTTAESSRLTEVDLTKVLTRLKTKQQPAIPYEEVINYDPFQDLPMLRTLTKPASAPPSISSAPVLSVGIDSDTVEAAKPASVAEAESPQPRTMEEIKTSLQMRTISAVLHGADATSAIIDERIVHIGEFLEPGVRIVAIEPTGIVVQIEPD